MKYVGLDLHKKNIFATVLDDGGKIISKAQIRSKKEDIYYYLKKQQETDNLSIAMEASYNWQYYYRIIENLTDNITLAHPLKTRIIGEAKIKTDKIDSRVLAYMLKADMLPACYVPTKNAMENKILLRSRISLVRIRTQIKNRIHTIIDRNRDSYNGLLENLTDTFGKTGIKIMQNTKIDEVDYKILIDQLDLISYINEKIKNIEAEIGKKALMDDDIKLLKTIPGVGDFTAFLVKSEIDDIKRFSSKEKLCSYAGLVPSIYSSGEKLYRGRITKQGNKYIRWALCEAAQISLRNSLYFRYYYYKVKNKKNTNSAIIALARRMLEIIYIILKEKREYIEKPINILQLAAHKLV